MPSRSKELWALYIVRNGNNIPLVVASPETANHIYWTKDGTAGDATNTHNGTYHKAIGNGLYAILITAAETDCDCGGLSGTCTTAGAYIEPVAYTFELLPTIDPRGVGGVALTTGIHAPMMKVVDSGSHVTNINPDYFCFICLDSQFNPVYYSVQYRFYICRTFSNGGQYANMWVFASQYPDATENDVLAYADPVSVVGSYTACGTTDVIAVTAVASVGVTAPANWINAAAIADGAIDNATFAADVGSTAFASNVIAKAVDVALDAYNTTGVAKEATVATVDGIVDAIKAKTDELTFTVEHKVDATATATIDPTALETAIGNAVADADLATADSVAPQVFRDAMKLAPTAGAAAAGSLDAMIADVPTAAEVWAATTRTLTGASSGVGPASRTADADIEGTCFRNASKTLYASSVHVNGVEATPSNVSKILYTIYRIDSDDADDWVEITGHTDVELDVASVLYATSQTNADASDWTFRHVIDVTTNQAFEHADTTYLVEHRLTPTAGGQDTVVRFRLTCS